MVKRFSILLIVTFITFLLVPSAQAAILKEGNNVTISSDEAINDNYYVGAGSITVDGTINGDIVASGGYVTISGKINGDVIVAGGMVDISGEIRDSLRVAGGNIDLGGKTGGDALVFGGNLDFEKGAQVGKDLVIGVGSANLAGDVKRDIKGGGGNIQLFGDVGRHVKIQAQDLSLSSGATINGDLTYTSPEKANIKGGAEVKGKVTHKFPKRRAAAKPWALFLGSVVWFIFSLLATIVVGIILVVVFPRTTSQVVEAMASSPWLSLGLGFAVLILVPIAATIIAFTLIGMPLSLIIFTIYGLALYFSKIFVGIMAGKIILRSLVKEREVHLILCLLLGYTLIALLGNIPLLGFLARFVYLLFGLGAMALALSRTYRKENV